MAAGDSDAKKSALGLQIKLMAREADERLADAESLESRLQANSSSAYLLRLLAFEILLKATVRIHGGAPKRTHGYLSLAGWRRGLEECRTRGA